MLSFTNTPVAILYGPMTPTGSMGSPAGSTKVITCLVPLGKVGNLLGPRLAWHLAGLSVVVVVLLLVGGASYTYLYIKYSSYKIVVYIRVVSGMEIQRWITHHFPRGRGTRKGKTVRHPQALLLHSEADSPNQSDQSVVDWRPFAVSIVQQKPSF